MSKKWIMYALVGIGATLVGLWVYRKINPLPNPQRSIYVKETNDSKITLGDTKVYSKKDWDYIQFINSLPKD